MYWMLVHVVVSTLHVLFYSYIFLEKTCESFLEILKLTLAFSFKKSSNPVTESEFHSKQSDKFEIEMSQQSKNLLEVSMKSTKEISKFCCIAFALVTYLKLL